MKAIAIGSLLLGGLAIAGAQNVVPMAPKKGVWSLGFSFEYFKPQNGTATTTLNVTPTYFVTDNIEVGAGLGWTHVSGSDSSFVNALARYYFNGQGTSQLKPFVGVVFQTSHSTGNPTGTLWGGELGAHYFVANNVAVTFAGIWEQFRVSGGTSQSEIQFDAGLTIFFAGAK
jgi:hypothetical protein